MRRHLRCLTRAPVAAAGGLLGAAFVPVAIAFADNYSIVPDPNSTETVIGFYGLADTPLPVVPGSVQGYQLFDVVDTTTGTTVGTFAADESTTPGNGDNQEFLVTHDVSGSPGTAAGDVPPVGSVIDISPSTPSAGSEGIYSDLASPSGDTITYTEVTPFGSTTSPGTFDAAAGLADNSLGNTAVPLANGYALVPTHKFAEQVTAVNGEPPYWGDVQGDQQFNIDNPAGATIGTFDAEETNTKDAFGNHTEALLVTKDLSGPVGTAPGDVPPPGSVYNIIYYGSSYSTYSIYSDLPSKSGGVITYTDVSPFGSSTSPGTFDAAKALTADKFMVPGKYEIAPASPEVFSGINGLPPSDVAVQGYQQFAVDNPTTGAQIGTIDADVTTTLDNYGDSGEALIVTKDVSGIAGTGSGDVPPVGSVFDVSTSGSGETIYFDLPAPTGDMVSEYAVTPFGDFPVSTTYDLAASLVGDHFFVPLAF